MGRQLIDNCLTIPRRNGYCFDNCRRIGAMNRAEFEADARREATKSARERSSQTCTASRICMIGTPGCSSWMAI
jgi:hypothetical protein